MLVYTHIASLVSLVVG